MNGTTKVLYIAGSGRCGSTILANVLGEVPGFCSTGEVRFLWDRGVLEDRHCGCGEPFSACPFWQQVMARGCPALDAHTAKRLCATRRRGPHPRHFLIPGQARRITDSAEFREFSDATARVHHATREIAGCRVVVDSSKYPSYQHVLEAAPGLDLFTLHLVRDPRAVAYSWWYRDQQTSPYAARRFPRFHPARTAVWWTEWNALLRRVAKRRPGRYLLLRYEDFVSEPARVLARILGFLGEAGAANAVDAEGQVQLGLHHTVSGNPSRFRTGLVKIRDSEAWRTGMSRSHRALVSALTWWEARRYGYTLAVACLIGA